MGERVNKGEMIERNWEAGLGLRWQIYILQDVPETEENGIAGNDVRGKRRQNQASLLLVHVVGCVDLFGWHLMVGWC